MVIVIFNLLWSKFVETNTTFRSASTDLDHASRSVEADRNVAFISSNSLQSKLKNYYLFDSWNHEQYIPYNECCSILPDTGCLCHEEISSDDGRTCVPKRLPVTVM